MAKSVSAEIPAEFQHLRQYMKVEPQQFKDLKLELGLTNQECATAIGRTLSRVSELTNSKGASQAIYDRVEPLWRAAAQAKATPEVATE